MNSSEINQNNSNYLAQINQKELSEPKVKGMDRRVPFETLRKRKLIMEIYKRYRYIYGVYFQIC